MMRGQDLSNQRTHSKLNYFDKNEKMNKYATGHATARPIWAQNK